MENSCTQNWQTMLPIPQGKFCQSCSKPVRDFQAWSRTDILAYYQKHPQACGRFRVEQIDPDLLPLTVVTKRFAKPFVLICLALVLNKACSAQSKQQPDTVLNQHLPADWNEPIEPFG
jgi:hypothetical protein